MQESSHYWLNLATKEILEHYPVGDLVVSSGISPSASYHVGHFREILTADAICWGLRKSGRKVTHTHVVDNFDPLRKRYDWLPESYESYVGQPICIVPDPFDKCRARHLTYAEHFYQEFEKYARAMGIGGEGFKVIRSYEDLYLTGKMATQIEKVIEMQNLVRQIFKDMSNRELGEDWLPLQLLGPHKDFNELRYQSIEKKNHQIMGVDSAGTEINLDYSKGEVKLNWRLDWPARWQVLGVKVEPFSAQEHGAAGGSYDTGVRFSREIFGYEPPIPGVRYANIHLVGDNKKMSSSKNNLITPEEALRIMPAEILRYFIVRSKPDRTLYFDSGIGLFNLIDEYSQIEHKAKNGEKSEFYDAWEFASGSNNTPLGQKISSVAFNHLVSVYQAANANSTEALKILARTGYTEEVSAQKEVILTEFKFVANWLEQYAPESVKFKIQDSIPQLELGLNEKKFLKNLSEAVAAHNDIDGNTMHKLIYDSIQSSEIAAGAAFKAIYQVILAKDSGPKAGWFLASLDRSWLIARLALLA
ncbi:MAG: lysine--tRNA ligase [Candidatus Saccharimonadia bacterium]